MNEDHEIDRKGQFWISSPQWLDLESKEGGRVKTLRKICFLDVYGADI
jgi:hypothetical protein